MPDKAELAPPPGIDPKVWELMTDEERASVVAFAEYLQIRKCAAWK